MSTAFEYPQRLAINTGDRVNAVTFTADGEHLIGGSAKEGVRVWRVKDGEQIATMPAKGYIIQCVAASGDGNWIAAGTFNGGIFVWDATTHERVLLAHEGASCHADFSPDSTRLVFADDTATASIWDIARRQEVRRFGHNNWQRVKAVKYSPHGDQIVTATISQRHESVRVWDSNDGRLFINIQVPVVDLLWGNRHLFVQTKDCKIKKINTTTRSTVSEWSIPHTNPHTSHVTQPQNRSFMACSANETVTFWDSTTHAQLGLIRHTHEIRSIASSLDGQLFAIAVERKIIVKELFHPLLDPVPDIDSAALNAWKDNQLTETDELLSAEIRASPPSNVHHVFASRALVRARLHMWDAALADAKQSIEIQQSLVGYIAKCVALGGKGEKDEQIQERNKVHSDYVTLRPLIEAIVLFVTGKHRDAISRTDDLITDLPVDPALYVVQAYMHLLRGSEYMGTGDYERAIQSFDDARIKLGNRTRQPPLIVSLISGWTFDGLAITIHQRLFEALFAAGRTKEARESVLRMVEEDIDTAKPIDTSFSDFKNRCRRELQVFGDNAMDAGQYDEAISRYSAALSLDLPGSQDLLVKRSNAWACKGAWEDVLSDVKGWARSMLTSGSWKDALAAATVFTFEKFIIYWAVCEDLEMTGHAEDAVACFHQISGGPTQEIYKELADWTFSFKYRWRRKLENLGDSSMDAKQYDEAVSQYTAALSLDRPPREGLLAKRSEAFAMMNKWEDALNDANSVIELDPSSPLGYERKYHAFRGAGNNLDATDAFETMLLKVSESSDPEIHERFRSYVRPERTMDAIHASIRNAVQEAIRDSPSVLINTLSGHLCNKSEQAAAFESAPAFERLAAGMATSIDYVLIEQAVGDFYRYATLSHTWEVNEPLYKTVIKTVVYDLERSPTCDKLQMFCKIVRGEGINWAWSDTCCIDKADLSVLQEAVVSMFKWYEGSALTIIFLSDVDQLAEIGALMMSRWNSRGWTLWEYHASKVVRIYTKDWTPYLGLTIYNHKESPEIISEMEQATGISAQSLGALRPGLNGIREKLRLASTRQTTRVEDAAYSLLGIFSMTLPATYGEGDKALGRLLSLLLLSSGDTSILAWTGKSGSFNSCLPTNIFVYSQPLTSYIPPAIPDAEMATIAAGLHASSLDRDLVTTLYDQLDDLPPPSFSGQRMKLPCLAFKIRTTTLLSRGSEAVFHARAGGLGVVEIKTRQNIANVDSLYLIHPWINYLVGRHAPDNTLDFAPHGEETFEFDESLSLDSPRDPFEPSTVDKKMEFLARLRQPFGALLFAPIRQNVPEYRRISAENLITVQVQEFTAAILNGLIEGVRMLDVL